MNYLENDIKVAKALQALMPLGGYTYTITPEAVTVTIQADGLARGYVAPTKVEIDNMIEAIE